MSSPSHASPEQQSRATRTAPGRQTPPSVEADRTRSLESDHPHTTTTGRQTNAPVEADGRSSLEAEHPGNTPAICPTDQDAVTPQRTGVHGTIDKQSYDYMMRSGIAGGLAGCAVCSLPSTSLHIQAIPLHSHVETASLLILKSDC